MPVSNTDAEIAEALARRFCWQVSVFADARRPGDPVIEFELHEPLELMSNTEFPHERMCPEIVDFAFNGVAVDREGTQIPFVDKDGEAFQPTIFHLRALFAPETGLDRMTARIRQVERGRSPRPGRIRVRFSVIRRALEAQGTLLRSKPQTRAYANWVQARPVGDAAELILVRPPDLGQLDKKGDAYEIRDRQHGAAGVIVLVDEQMVRHLLDVVPGMLRDLDLLAAEFYGSRKRE